MVNPSNKNILVVLWCYGNCQIQIRHGTNSTIGYWIVLLRNQHLGYRRCNSSRTSDACFKGLYFVIKSFFSRNGNGNIQLQNSTYRNCTIIIMFYKIIQNYIVYGTRRWDTILDGRKCEIERSEWSFSSMNCDVTWIPILCDGHYDSMCHWIICISKSEILYLW